MMLFIYFLFFFNLKSFEQIYFLNKMFGLIVHNSFMHIIPNLKNIFFFSLNVMFYLYNVTELKWVSNCIYC